MRTYSMRVDVTKGEDFAGSAVSGAGGADRGLLYGEACFETMRVVDGAIFAWERHEARLARGLAAFGLDRPDGLLEQCLAAAEGHGSDVMLRLTVSGGDAPRGLLVAGERQPQVHIQAWTYRDTGHPLHLRSLHWPMGGVARIAKFTSDYAFTIRLLQQARREGLLAGNEQALFTFEESLLCMETGNLLLRVDGEWVTPDSDAVLLGVVRSELIAAGLVRPCRCPQDWLLACDAMAVCNSGCFIRPVAAVNGRLLDTHAVHFAPLCAALVGRPGVPGDVLCA